MGDRVLLVLASKEPEVIYRERRSHVQDVTVSDSHFQAQECEVGKQTATTTEDGPEAMSAASARLWLVQEGPLRRD